MTPHFACVQLIGGNFDIESENLRGTPSSEAGVALFFSACALYPNTAQVHHWCSLARVAQGAPIDCRIWQGEGETRKPVGAIRMRCQSDHGEMK